jgi:hypothetical protein
LSLIPGRPGGRSGYQWPAGGPPRGRRPLHKCLAFKCPGSHLSAASESAPGPTPRAGAGGLEATVAGSLPRSHAASRGRWADRDPELKLTLPGSGGAALAPGTVCAAAPWVRLNSLARCPSPTRRPRRPAGPEASPTGARGPGPCSVAGRGPSQSLSKPRVIRTGPWHAARSRCRPEPVDTARPGPPGH